MHRLFALFPLPTEVQLLEQSTTTESIVLPFSSAIVSGDVIAVCQQ
jgi:hypothetical protein